MFRKAFAQEREREDIRAFEKMEGPTRRERSRYGWQHKAVGEAICIDLAWFFIHLKLKKESLTRGFIWKVQPEVIDCSDQSARVI